MATTLFGDFEWDSEKAAVNFRKHGVSFEEAASVFLDLDMIVLPDSHDANRFSALGYSRLAHLLFVVHVERGERVRIISARRATRTEAGTYERRKQTD